MGVQGVLALEDPMGGLRRRAVSEAHALELELELELKLELKENLILKKISFICF